MDFEFIIQFMIDGHLKSLAVNCSNITFRGSSNKEIKLDLLGLSESEISLNDIIGMSNAASYIIKSTLLEGNLTNINSVTFKHMEYNYFNDGAEADINLHFY